MTTLIDSFVVEIGLDPKNFTKGQREALDAFKKTQEEALKGGKSIEEQSKKSMDALGGIKTQALELFAVFTGGKSLIEFVSNTVATNAQLGRLERNLNISAATIAKWQGAARVFGGDGAQMAATFTTISDAIEGFKIGRVSPLIAEFRNLSAAGGTIIDINKGVDQTLLDISANLAKINAENPARAGLLGRMIGLDPGLYDLLVKGPKATQEILDKVNALGPATKAATDAAGDLERRWNSIAVKANAFGIKVLNSGAGDRIGNLADELNKPFLEAKPWDALLGTGAYAPGAKPAAGSRKSGAFTSQVEKEAFIRSEAARRGINPDVPMAVARSEGFNSFTGDKGTSFGAFQLHVTPGGGGNAVGDQFRKATGLDPGDRANERAAIAFALDDARAHGWGAYHGAANSHIGAWAGIDGASTSTTTTSIVTGPVTIQVGPNADGRAIAGQFVETLRRQSNAYQSTNGQN
jgi:hypothetical protein